MSKPLAAASLATSAQSITDRFRGVVAARPEELAVQDEATSYTYGELDRESSRIANFLLDRLGPASEPIAMLMPHGARMLTVHLGILKAGKFYVPLDVSYPDSRNRMILQDVGSRLLLTCDATEEAGRRLAGGVAQTTNVEQLATSVSAADPALAVAPDAYAYVFYTSGTTGTPKGVIENHRDVLHMVDVASQSMGLTRDDRLLMVAPLIFSASSWQVLATFLIGAAVFPFDMRTLGMGAALVDTIEHNRITCWSCVPSTFRSTAAYLLASDRRLDTLRILKLSGDRILASDFELYRRCCGDGCVLRIEFGMSEVQNITCLVVDKAMRFDQPRMPVGFPALGNEVFLLDDEGRAVPRGEVGEFVVRTAFASPGYWQRPELTAQRFKRDGDKTLFYTGDLGRQDADGCFHHVGRKDNQVKIAGNRVELGDVETALIALDGVRECLTLLHEGEGGSMMLTAYYIPVQTPPPSASTLRAALRQRLPDYMVPAAYVPMDAFPLNANGKLDRRQLAPPARREHRI
jgi:amino acid adenylation domain-containing protein